MRPFQTVMAHLPEPDRRLLVCLALTITCLGCDVIVGPGDLPQPVDDLMALANSNTTVTLTWTAPTAKKDRLVRLSGYEIRFSTEPMTTREDWANASVVVQSITPEEPGTREFLRVFQMGPGQDYYFGIRTQSPNGNQSEAIGSAGVRVPPDAVVVPSFSAADFSGTTHSSQEWVGRTPLVVNFWASWCGPCRDEMDDLLAVYEEVRPLGVEFLGMASQSDFESALAYIEQYGPEWPQLIATDSIRADWAIHAYPTTVFITASGNVYTSLRGSRTAEQFRTVIDLMLSDSSALTMPGAQGQPFGSPLEYP